jgi:biopolymer transport protein ExbD
MAGRKRSYAAMASINITSLVDVTLTLLIIFMLTAPYIQGGVEVNLPEAGTRNTVVKEGPVISITSNRQVFFPGAGHRDQRSGHAAGSLRGGQGHRAGLPAQ